MKEAVVVGGSNGIGLAVAKRLMAQGRHVYILDRQEPDRQILTEQEGYTYMPCNLLHFEDSVFEALSQKETVDTLVITAGFGRVADFEKLHSVEIQNMLQVNTVAAIRIIRMFYHRIKQTQPFYSGIMGSIAGLVSSPMFSVYAASKAAICRFVESVNIELEAAGVSNRILNVAPGSIKGTRFNGGANDISQMEQLAAQIVDNMQQQTCLFIPDYEPVYRGVIQRYQADPYEFGRSSYAYKQSSGRVTGESRIRIGYLSGTFDLFHIGHLNLLRRAKAQCDYLIVGVHPDASHKGKETYIPFEERKEIVASIQYVDKVITSCKEDSDAWDLLHYHKLFVGSDYKGTERFNRYEAYFADKDVEIVYFPYTQGTSSTQLREAIDSK